MVRVDERRVGAARHAATVSIAREHGATQRRRDALLRARARMSVSSDGSSQGARSWRARGWRWSRRSLAGSACPRGRGLSSDGWRRSRRRDGSLSRRAFGAATSDGRLSPRRQIGSLLGRRRSRTSQLQVAGGERLERLAAVKKSAARCGRSSVANRSATGELEIAFAVGKSESMPARAGTPPISEVPNGDVRTDRWVEGAKPRNVRIDGAHDAALRGHR